jgi:hypothetical protein
MSAEKQDGLGLVGIGAAVCVACCAGPILAFLGGLSLAGIVSTLFIGVAGVGIAVLAVAGLLVIRRCRAGGSCPPGRAEPVAVAPPTTKLPVR